MDNLISIIIPLYNHAAALRKALDSIVKQTCKSIEIVIVDDGSTKHFEIPKYRDVEIPVKLVKQSHRGAPTARNRGLSKASGAYVIFWDADVIAKPEMLQKMLAALKDHPEASFAYSNFYFGWKKMPAQTFDIKKLKEINYIHSTSLIRREAVVPWDESLKRFQDWDLWLTMAEQRRTGVWIPDYLFRVIPHYEV